MCSAVATEGIAACSFEFIEHLGGARDWRCCDNWIVARVPWPRGGRQNVQGQIKVRGASCGVEAIKTTRRSASPEVPSAIIAPRASLFVQSLATLAASRLAGSSDHTSFGGHVLKGHAPLLIITILIVHLAIVYNHHVGFLTRCCKLRPVDIWFVGYSKFPTRHATTGPRRTIVKGLTAPGVANCIVARSTFASTTAP